VDKGIILKLLKTPLLARRGAETDERSESGEAGWWIYYSHHPVTCLRQASSFVALSALSHSCHPSWPACRQAGRPGGEFLKIYFNPLNPFNPFNFITFAP
jgi:hypothetical protein